MYRAKNISKGTYNKKPATFFEIEEVSCDCVINKGTHAAPGHNHTPESLVSHYEDIYYDGDHYNDL